MRLLRQKVKRLNYEWAKKRVDNETIYQVVGFSLGDKGKGKFRIFLQWREKEWLTVISILENEKSD